MSSIWCRKRALSVIASKPAYRPSLLAGRIRPPPNMGSVSILTSPRWSRRWIRCAKSLAARTSISGGRAREASRLRRFLPTLPRAARRKSTARPLRLSTRYGGRAKYHGRIVCDAGIGRGGKARVATCRRGRRPGTGADVRLDAAQRSDLELLGQQLSAWQCAARFRHFVLEQRHHTTAVAASR